MSDAATSEPEKKPEDEPLRDFVSHDPMPMEDHDPDLVMNPIFLARMAAE